MDRRPRPDGATIPRRPLTFCVLVFALSIPFWLAGALFGTLLLPGLPVVDAAAVVCPLLAASVMVHHEGGGRAVGELLRRAIDYRRIRPAAWYGPILLIMPAATLLAYAAMRLLGRPLPPPHLSPWALPALFPAFVVGAMAEELGWTGYASEAALRDRWSVARTGLTLGVVTAAWHVIPLAYIGRTATWIGWWCVWTVAGRVLTVWLFERAGRSVFAAALFHAATNTSWQLFPNGGSHWDPQVNGLVAGGIAAVALAIDPAGGAGVRRKRR